MMNKLPATTMDLGIMLNTKLVLYLRWFGFLSKNQTLSKFKTPKGLLASYYFWATILPKMIENN